MQAAIKLKTRIKSASSIPLRITYSTIWSMKRDAILIFKISLKRAFPISSVYRPILYPVLKLWKDLAVTNTRMHISSRQRIQFREFDATSFFGDFQSRSGGCSFFCRQLLRTK